jgi:hypothetical protein
VALADAPPRPAYVTWAGVVGQDPAEGGAAYRDRKAEVRGFRAVQNHLIVIQMIRPAAWV